MLDLKQLQSDMQALDKGDEASRRQAIHALKHHGEQDWAAAPVNVVNSLVRSLQNQLRSGVKQLSVRQEVAVVLGNLGPRSETAIPQILEMMQEGVPDAICETAVIALGKIGKEAKAGVDQLINLLASRRPSLVIQAVRALGEIGCADQRVKTALGNLWLSAPQSQKSQVQVAIALCKLKIDARDLARYLTATLMTNQDSALRKAAIEGLAYCNKNEVDVVPALLAAAVHDKDETVRVVAEGGLKQLGLTHEKAIQLCAKQLMVSAFAEAALRHSGQPAVPALTDALESDESTIREKAARILGGFGELAVAAVPALTGLLRDKDLNVRLAVAKGLWHITKNADVIIPVLADLLDNKWTSAFEAGESRRRFIQTVMESLGRIGPPAKAAIPALKNQTKDKNRLISECATAALKEIAPVVVTKVGSR
ncbi:MAG TPA: HEAT repeat domain-containing protein [Gemmataceae bacterium]|nr:HEAT repeat domain-containing protein [Gemmataceae bacterium]